MRRSETGRRGEGLARDFLAGRGYRIDGTNYRSPYGEIDIIAHQGNTLVFVEVRAKTSRDFGTPAESITARKQGHLRAAAAHYLQGHPGAPADWRIDLVTVELDDRGRVLRIGLIENAVEGD